MGLHNGNDVYLYVYWNGMVLWNNPVNSWALYHFVLHIKISFTMRIMFIRISISNCYLWMRLLQTCVYELKLLNNVKIHLTYNHLKIRISTFPKINQTNVHHSNIYTGLQFIEDKETVRHVAMLRYLEGNSSSVFYHFHFTSSIICWQ